MKKIIILAFAIALALTSVAQTKEMQEMKVYNKDSISYYTNLTTNDSFIFDGFRGDRIFRHIRDGVELLQRPLKEIDSIFFKPFKVPQYDIGVFIKGVTWATRNVAMPGTFAANPEDAGMFYQWNSKIGWSSTDPMTNSTGDTLQWNNQLPASQTWLIENDPCPTGWHVPTLQDMESLISAGSLLGELNGVAGHFFGDSNNKLFLPAAKCRIWSDGNLGVSTMGFYWSCVPKYGVPDYNAAYALSFDNKYYWSSTQGYVSSYGHSVRCVNDIDLGTFDVGVVINGVKWATRNVAAQGKFVEKPEDYGALFQWGRVGDGHEQRTSPKYPTNDNSYENGIISGDENFDANGQIVNTHDAYGKFIKQSVSPYDWRSPQLNTLWNSGTETTPVKTVNDPCPVGWRLPTQTELTGLRSSTNSWVTNYQSSGINGQLFGTAPNQIFLPAAGYRPCNDGEVVNAGTYGRYWSSSVDDIYARNLVFSDGDVHGGGNGRAYGFSVRCVAE
jgi:uncharacterized protein (TIGR02145 family)